MDSQFPWDIVTSLGIQFYHLDDKRLEAGNEICNHNLKLPCFAEDEEGIRDVVDCTAFGCNLSFPSLSEYENHYKSRHTHVCNTCALILPSNHLLDLHILEAHDSFFAIRAEKEPLYVCLLQFCSMVFANESERKQHCIKSHGFARDFCYFYIGRSKEHCSKKHSRKPKETQHSIDSKPKINDKSSSQSANFNSRLGSETSEMEHSDLVDSEMAASTRNSSQITRKVPSSVCFGIGVPIGFVSKPRRGRTHWHQKGKNGKTRKNLDISMKDINKVLHEMES